MNLEETIGFSLDAKSDPAATRRHVEYVNLKLAARGLPVAGDPADFPFLEIGKSFFANFQEKSRLLSDYLCPADQAIHDFLTAYLADVPGVFAPGELTVPASPLILERHGLGRVLSLPAKGDVFESDIVSSYRLKQGICHNPKHDRRTTEGVFHITEGGLPIPGDKKAVPKLTFAHLLRHALNPPPELLRLPFTSELDPADQAEVFVSLLLRPIVCPEVPGVIEEKSMEIRFFAPGNLVSNLDFVGSIFGNAGDPFLPDNDARLDSDHWTGHTGGVILAPHLITLTKKQLGLPHIDKATDRQKRDGMCWESEDDLYNNGQAFKITCRDHRGIMVTIIADNYFGYCKKEVKTQISFAANLYGLAEEEHSGGAIAYPRLDLGETFQLSDYNRLVDHTWDEVVANFSDVMHLQPEGYGIDKIWPDIFYLPESSHIDLHSQTISWQSQNGPGSLKLLPDRTYVMPSGYKVEMGRPDSSQRWRLVGTNAEGTFLHKPCTVSGGGKSEISKALTDAMISGSIFVANFDEGLSFAEQIIARDYGDRFKNPRQPQEPSRPLLDPHRSFGSVIRMLSPAENYTDDYNAWLRSIPRWIRDFVFTVKRFWKPDWGDDWKSRFSVDMINGEPGNELKYRSQRLKTNYLRVGFSESGAWRTFVVRKDFVPSAKIQTEDDITASIVIPAETLKKAGSLHPDLDQPAYKFSKNCEYRLFQRPDDAVIRGYDIAAEADFCRPGSFFSNYDPIGRAEARDMVEDTIRFGHFTPPVQKLIRQFAAEPDGTSPSFITCTARPRTVNGVPTKNPRYLQDRPDLRNPRASYLAEIGSRLYRRTPVAKPLYRPVNSIIPGRRNNPPDHAAGIRALAVYGPVHYQELPELFMDFIASLTGKSPSTTGAGSEGALTKGPFNALPPIIDLNNALISYILCAQPVFSSAAGYIGHKFRVDHDISLIVPEVWSRMFIHERDPDYLISEGFLERCQDSQHNGAHVLASRLGWRINERFVNAFFGRVFSDPASVFTDEMLRPELQSMDNFADAMDNIVTTQRNVALHYFDDGSIDFACPPLNALLHIMAHGSWFDKDVHHPDVRHLFSRASMVGSDWYNARIDAKVASERELFRRHVDSLEAFLKREGYEREARRLGIESRLKRARARLKSLNGRQPHTLFDGTLGLDPTTSPQTQ